MNKKIVESNEDQIQEKTEYYRNYIADHISRVHKAYERIVKDYAKKELSENQIKELETNIDRHDNDKRIPFIFDAYRRDHYPINDEEKEQAAEDYEIAWFYHKKNNPHHWEYWLDGDDKFSRDPDLEKIKVAYMEMLCDWLSFGFMEQETSATGESTEFEDWYRSATDIKLHPELEDWFKTIVEDVIVNIRKNKDEIYKKEESKVIENKKLNENEENNTNFKNQLNKVLDYIRQNIKDLQGKEGYEAEIYTNIYYMNGNDGTEFDWEMNDRTCEFMVFYKGTQMGIIKCFVTDKGKIEGISYPDDGNGKPNTLSSANFGSEEEADEFAQLLFEEYDDNGKWNVVVGIV